MIKSQIIFVAAIAGMIATAPAVAAQKKVHSKQPQGFPSPVVEQDGNIDDKITPELLSGLVFLVRHKGGFVCDTVRYAYPFIFGVGVHLTCNGGLYRYEISQPGGEWQVVAK